LLSHRGPDDSGEFVEPGIFLGHRRLSIIDLSQAANQPFFSGDGNAIIVFNGEIYNYKELSDGLSLRTTSDTEVLLEGFLKFGLSFFQRIRGIYAFVIYDKRTHQLIFYRDPAGIKPLYYTIQEGSISFASEIKSLYHLFRNALSINENAIKSYLSLGYVSEPSTIYNEIRALNPGTLLCYDINTNCSTEETLFSYTFDQFNQLSFANNLSQTESLLKRACERNKVADVEVNIALSGGIDSSLINYYVSKFNTGRSITVRFSEDSYDESSTAADFARHLSAEHFISDVKITNQLELLNKLLIHFDQPYGDSSLIPFYFLSKSASNFSKVIMGGDGGDEIHNGYNSQRLFPFLSSIQSHFGGMMVSRSMKAMGSALSVEQSRLMMKFGSLLATHSGDELAFNLLSWFPALQDQYPINPFKYLLADLHKGFTRKEKLSLHGGSLIEAVLFQERLRSDYLRKADMMSMINGVEYRIPMLDEDLVSFSLSIPYDQKSSLFKSKKMLRAIHKKYFPSYSSKLKKQGFSLPLDNWLGDPTLKYIESYILDENGIVLNYIEPEYVKILFRTLKEEKLRRFCSRESAYQRILILYSLQLWYREIYL